MNDIMNTSNDAETEAIRAIREEEFKDYARKVMV